MWWCWVGCEVVLGGVWGVNEVVVWWCWVACEVVLDGV